MSVQDVCDLGSLLHSRDSDTEHLQKKLVGHKAEIITQEGRLQHEIEETEKELQSVPDIEIKSKKLEHDMDIIQLKYSLLSTETERCEKDQEKVKTCYQLHSELIAEVDASLSELTDAKIEMEKARLCILNNIRNEMMIEDQNQILHEQNLDNIRSSLQHVQTALEKLALQHFAQMMERASAEEDCQRKDCQLVDLREICNSLKDQIKDSAVQLSDVMAVYDSKLNSLQDGIISLSLDVADCNTAIYNCGQQFAKKTDEYQDAFLMSNDERDVLALKTLELENIKAKNVNAREHLLEHEKYFQLLKNEYAAILQGIENEGIRRQHFEDSSIVVRSFDEIQEEVKSLQGNIAHIRNEISMINTEISGEVSSTDIGMAVSILKSVIAQEFSVQQKLDELGESFAAADGSSIIASLQASTKGLHEQILIQKTEIVREINGCNVFETSDALKPSINMLNQRSSPAEMRTRYAACHLAEKQLDEEAKALSEQRIKLNSKLLEVEHAIKSSYDREEKAQIKACKEAAICSRRLTAISRHETAMSELRKEMTAEDDRFQRACKPTADMCDSLRTQLARLKQEIATSLSGDNTRGATGGRGLDSHLSRTKPTRPDLQVENENVRPNTSRPSSPTHILRGRPSPSAGKKRVPQSKGLSQSSHQSNYFNDDWGDDDAFSFNPVDQKKRK